MASKKLAALITLIIILSAGHDIDHYLRGDFGAPPGGRALVSAVLFAKYAFLGAGLFFYLKRKIGPLFWAIATGTGVILGLFAHFSPFSEQTPLAIYRAYAAPEAGIVAVSALALLMLVLAATAIYAQRLWAKGFR